MTELLGLENPGLGMVDGMGTKPELPGTSWPPTWPIPLAGGAMVLGAFGNGALENGALENGIVVGDAQTSGQTVGQDCTGAVVGIGATAAPPIGRKLL